MNEQMHSNSTEKLTGMKNSCLKIPEKDKIHVEVGRHHVHTIAGLKLEVRVSV